jgi:putative ABC transport system permease protein
MPNWNHIVREHLAALRLPPEREIEIVEELALCFEAVYEDALAAGLSEAEAEARAVRNYDWRLLECELSRAERPLTARALQPSTDLIEQTGGIRMESFIQDLRFGVRMLVKNPGFTLIAVLTLALGIGANTAIFTVVNAVLLQPLPYPEAQQLALISENFSQRNLNQISVSAPEYLDYRNRSRSFAQVAAYRRQSFTLTGAGEAELMQGAVCSTNLFDALGIKPALGRAFLSGEDQPGYNQVVVLSHGLWQRRFGADPRVVGQKLTLNNNVVEVVGVAPPGFQFPPPTEIWSPIAFTNELLGQRLGPRNLRVLARLKPENSLQSAQAEMNTLARNLQEQYPEAYPASMGWSVTVTSLREQVVGGVQTALWTLLGAVGFVLLIACANVANLLLARAAAREREVAIRAALGAGRLRIVRQLLTESVTLACAGGLLGALIAWQGVKALLTLNPDVLPTTAAVGIDATVMAFTTLVSLLTGVGFGLAPALRAAKIDLSGAMKERGSGGGIRRYGLRNGLVVLEVALSLVLVVGAGLLVRSFLQVRAINPGFEAENILTMRIALPQTKYPEQQQVANFYKEVLERVKTTPGVEEAGLIAGLPLSGSSSSWGFTTEAKPQPTLEEILQATYRVVSPGYFDALRIPLRRGRDITDADNESAPGVVIINETLARRYWPNEDALGKRIKLGSPEPQRAWDGLWLTIIGVVGDVRAVGLENEATPEMYLPYLQNPWRGMPNRPYMTLVGRTMSLAVRGAAASANLTTAIRQAIAAVDKDQPVAAVGTLESLLASSLAQRRFNLSLLSLFATVALALAAIGLYGVMSYGVSQRTQEIGLRMAMGAEARDVQRLVIGQGMKLALAGVLIGLGGAIALTRLLSTLLFAMSATDPLTFGVVALLFIGVALAACWIPARRATKVDPLTALRHD